MAEEQSVVYPRYKYHESHKPRVVKNAHEEHLLGDEWKDSPADFGVVTAPSVEQIFQQQTGVDMTQPEEETKQEAFQQPPEDEEGKPRRRR